MKLDLEDLWYLVIYIPWEIFVCAIGAVAGWPFHDRWGWFMVGIVSWVVYDCRKELML